MPRSLQAYLWDIEQAASDILTFTTDKQLSDYENNSMLRAAVERKFEVIGEALSQAQRHFPGALDLLSDDEQIIAFRNRLIHGYATVRNALVWDIVQVNLPRLLEQVIQLRRQFDPEQG